MPPETLPLETCDRVPAVDLRGTCLSCLAFGPRMARRGRGSIITIASITGVNLPVDAGWLTAGPWHTYGGVRPARPPEASSA